MVRAGAADARIACAAAAFFAVVTAAYCWPLPLHLTHAVPHDSGDPLLVTWILWWSSHVMPLTDRWWNAPAFHPSTGVFAFSETLLGVAPLAAPILWLGEPPLLAYNVVFLASFVLTACSAYLLGFVLTRRHDAALIAGTAFAFSPYRLAHLNHLQLLAAFWMPLGVAALHLYGRDGRLRWAVLFAFAWLLQALTSGYYFFLFSLFVAGWLLFFALRWPFRRLGTLLVCWFAAALLIVPLLTGYKRIQDAYGFRRVPAEIAYYSADIAGIVSAPPESRFWNRMHPVDQPESQLFPGVTVFVLLVAAVIVRSDEGKRALLFYLLMGGAMWLLSLGPAPRLQGRTLGFPGPYRLLMVLPGFDGIRVPARFWMVAVLSLAASGAIVVSRIKSSRVRIAATCLCVAGLLVDGWPASMALGADPGMQMTGTAAVARLGLPLQHNETETMYGAIAEARPVFNGYSGYTAPQHYALADLLDRRDPQIVQRLASGGPIEIVVRRDLDPDGSWAAFASSLPGAAVARTTAAWTDYLIPASRWTDSPPSGTKLRIAHLAASTDARDIDAVLDGDLDSRWHAAHQSGNETIVADLGEVERPTAVVMSLGVYASQYPRTLEVAISGDGLQWRTVWTGDTALATYDAAIRSPRAIPVTIPLPRRDARYIRLSQIGNDPSRGWSIVELEVRR